MPEALILDIDNVPPIEKVINARAILMSGEVASIKSWVIKWVSPGLRKMPATIYPETLGNFMRFANSPNINPVRITVPVPSKKSMAQRIGNYKCKFS